MNFILQLIFLVALRCWYGFVGMKLWNWYVPVALPGTPKLSWVVATGLTCLITFLTFRASQMELDYQDRLEEQFQSEKNKRLLKGVLFGVVMGLLYLGLGWLFTNWLPEQNSEDIPAHALFTL